MKTAKMNARRDLKLRRARQQAEWESQVPVTSHHPSPVRASQPLPNSKGKAQDYESSGMLYCHVLYAILAHSIC